MELGANAALILDAGRPGDDHAVASTTKMRSDLLGPLKRGVHRMSTSNGVVIEGKRAAQFVHPSHYHFKVFRSGVEERHLIEQTLRTALGTRSVVALNVDHQRVVQFAQFFDSIEHATDLVIAIG